MKAFNLLLTAFVALFCFQLSASTTVTVNGTNYTIPQTNEKGWGTNVTNWIVAISGASLQKNGGTFTLTNDVNFGSSYGLKAPYYLSQNINPSTSGVLRLGNTENVSWRNASNSANLGLTVDATNALTFNGATIATMTNGSMSGNMDASQITSGTITQARLGTVGIPAGGTGQTSANAAFNALSPATTPGDLVYTSSGTVAARLGIGSSGQLLQVLGGYPTWVGTIGASIIGGGTLAISTLGTLNGNIIGLGTINTAQLGTIPTSILSGTLASAQMGTVQISNGGTGQTTATAAFNALSPANTKGMLLTSDGTNNVALATGSANQYLVIDTTQAKGIKWQALGIGSPIVQSKSADYSLASSDDFGVGTAGMKWTLPAASTSKTLTVSNTSTATGTIATAGSDLVYPPGTTAIILPNKYDNATVESDGSASWHIKSYNRTPNFTKYTSGSGTFSVSLGAKYLRVKMVGGGGGGAGSGTGASGTGGTGGSTTFGSSFLTAAGGVGGAPGGGFGGSGGAATINAGASGDGLTGGNGSAAMSLAAYSAGGFGGSSGFGGGGGGGPGNGAGVAGSTNTGGGGGGGGCGSSTSCTGGPGGGAGAYIDAIVTTPSPTYTYAVGSGGTLGSAGTVGFAGAAGAAGYIGITEFFQ